jgi:hypothetical protein
MNLKILQIVQHGGDGDEQAMFFFLIFYLAIFVGYKCCACVSQKPFSLVFCGSQKLLRQTDLERTAATEAGWMEGVL